MLDPHQLLELVVRPTLAGLELPGTAAEQLLIGTAIQESGLRYIKQLNNGPALGICQMEPATHKDIWENYLDFRGELVERLCVATGIDFDETVSSHRHWSGRLVYNLRYAFAMCRIHYLRVAEPLPEVNDIEGQAAYWKRYYNTELGHGTVDGYIDNWRRVFGD